MAICSFADQISHNTGGGTGPGEFAELRTESGSGARLLELGMTNAAVAAQFLVVRALVPSIPTPLGINRFAWESDETDRLCPVLLVKAFPTSGLIKQGYSRNPEPPRAADTSITGAIRRAQPFGWVWSFPRGIKFSATSTLILSTSNSPGSAPTYHFVADA